MWPGLIVLMPRKINCLFPVNVRKNGEGCSESGFFFQYFFVQKCVFYACFFDDWESGGLKKL